MVEPGFLKVHVFSHHTHAYYNIIEKTIVFQEQEREDHIRISVHLLEDQICGKMWSLMSVFNT
jgi:hypothetical protein